MVRPISSRSLSDQASQGRQNKRGRQADAHVPDVYQEMLQEAEARDPEHFASERPIKRRKFGDLKAIPVDSRSLDQTHRGAEANEHDPQQMQTVYDSSGSEGSAESDVEWEDVEIQQAHQTLLQGPSASSDKDEMLQITLEQEPEKQKKFIQRRKPLTSTERKIRLDVHKSHVVCLLGHVHIRNMWCNDDELQVSIDVSGFRVGDVYLTT
jgi:xeroderma pigmentosum group C-complementing protein